MEKWLLQTKKADFNRIAKENQISPILARLMINRKIEEKEIPTYLHGGIEDLHNPHLLKDIDRAADIIEDVIKNKENITIASDFDDDGIFASFILYTAFRKLGADVKIDTPDRVREGYGLNERIVKETYEQGGRFILTCDNGIAALEAISYAKSLGMRVIVTDHHEVPYEEKQGERVYLLPQADAIVNPKQTDCMYPFKNLCGTGVAYKLIQVLYERFQIEAKQAHDLLEYVAIATVADVMDLIGENRTMVKLGLEQLAKTENKGLKALIDLNHLNPKRITAYHIGFVIGPCFNAAGRLDTVKIALDLLMEQDIQRAAEKAFVLKELNDSRKEMTRKGLLQAIEKIESEEREKDKIILVKLEDCHESLAGIIAGRLREKYHKPIFVFVEIEEGCVKGSGRSIEAYHMFQGLIECKELLLKFGGHPMAAGLTLKREHLEELRNRLNQNCMLEEKDFIPVVRIDAAMPLKYISEELIRELELLEPFGKGNTKPIFAEQHFSIKTAKIVGKNQNVLKMRIENREHTEIDGVYFGDIQAFHEFIVTEFGQEEVDRMYQGQSNHIDLAFTYYPSINEYMGKCTLQIVIQGYCRIKEE